MAKFVIAPHMRLHEWVAEEKGYFAAEGLDGILLRMLRLPSRKKNLVRWKAMVNRAKDPTGEVDIALVGVEDNGLQIPAQAGALDLESSGGEAGHFSGRGIQRVEMHPALVL